uniref:Uncharacterized protein n=1 Tax=Arundo donax TaxID=35708 RepID=A0A0A8YL94_ARUDO
MSMIVISNLRHASWRSFPFCNPAQKHVQYVSLKITYIRVRTGALSKTISLWLNHIAKHIALTLTKI